MMLMKKRKVNPTNASITHEKEHSFKDGDDDQGERDSTEIYI